MKNKKALADAAAMVANLNQKPTHVKPSAIMRPSFKAAMQDDGTLEMCIYGDIVDAATVSMLEAWGYPTDGFTSAAGIKKQIDAAGNYSKIKVRINSPGGDAFEGVAAYNILRNQGRPVETLIDGIAASSASIIAMAGDTITMGVNTMMMIHNGWCGCVGNAADMRKTADILDKVSEAIGATYVHRTGKSAKEIKVLMDAETYMTAQDCLDSGFCTAITETEDANAMALARQFQSRLKASASETEAPAAETVTPAPEVVAPKALEDDAVCACPCSACTDSADCANCTHDACACENCEDCPMKPAANSTAIAPVADSDISLYEARVAMLGKAGIRLA